MNPLNELSACGQSVWIDFLKRSFVEGGELRMRAVRDDLRGATSNPSIFEKAIGESNEYDAALKTFQAQRDHSISEIYEELAFQDIRNAADALRPVYDHTEGADGYISLECSPYVANDTEATLKEARHLWRAIARPNLMVKVPATKAGLPAIRALIAQGINVNITLLFSVDVYEQVADAYMSGLEDLLQAGGDVSKIASVASFFVSRIDTAVDKLLEDAPKEGAARLKGKAAIANAKVAYALFNLQERGRLFVSPGEQLYEGMIVGIHSRDSDLVVNPIRTKKLTNIRAAGKDEAILLTPPIQLTLEYAVEFIADDELVEVTPAAIRIRKRHLKAHERKRAARSESALTA